MANSVIVLPKFQHFYRKSMSASPNLRLDFKPEVELRWNGACAVIILPKNGPMLTINQPICNIANVTLCYFQNTFADADIGNEQKPRCVVCKNQTPLPSSNSLSITLRTDVASELFAATLSIFDLSG